MASGKSTLIKEGAGLLGSIFGRGAKKAAQKSTKDIIENTPYFMPTAIAGAVKPAVTDVLGGAVRSPRNIRNVLKKTGKYGLGLGAAGALISAITGRNQQPAMLPIDYSKINFGGTSPDTTSLLDEYMANSMKAINEAYSNMPAYNVPGAEMYNPLSGMANQVGGASIAEMQKLANAAAQTGAGVQAGGAQGAGAINDIYGGAAGEMADLASYGGEYGAMTPVSGAMATAPTEAQMQGQNLADFLKQSQMITSQDAGFLAGLAPILGTGYANELAMLDYAARQQAAMRQQQLQQEMAYETERARQNALLELALGGQSMALETGLAELGKQNRPFIDPSYVTAFAAQYEELIKDPNQLAVLRAQGINSVEDYINASLSASTGE